MVCMLSFETSQADGNDEWLVVVFLRGAAAARATSVQVPMQGLVYDRHKLGSVACRLGSSCGSGNDEEEV